MKNLLLLVSLFMVTVTSEAQTHKGYTQYSLVDGKIEIELPKDYSIRKDTTEHELSTGSTITTYKFKSKTDRWNNVTIIFMTKIDSVLNLEILKNMVDDIAQDQRINAKGSKIVEINGQQWLVADETITENGSTGDYTHQIYCFIENQTYFVEIAFGQADTKKNVKIANKITQSIRFKK